MCTHTSLCVGACVCVVGAGIYVGVSMCVHVCAHMEVRDQYEVSSLIALRCFETGSLTLLGSHWFSWAGWSASSTCLLSAGIGGACCCCWR